MAHGDITHIEIPVADTDAATAFYSSLFGWQIAGPPGFEDYPMWQAPNKISGGGLVARSGDLTQPRSYVEVDSIDAVLTAAVEAGGQVVMDKAPISDTSWWAVLQDPDGNQIGLYEGMTET
ncbi:VOC family protein [Janibacter sp. GS2]|uniref:VOC family protein n=1 Tax=Janibacter sp. GS2 TaxID=3442646 RepID=UPI003EBDA11C